MFTRPRFCSLALTALRLASHHLAALLAVYPGDDDAHGTSLRFASLCRHRLLSHTPHIVPIRHHVRRC